MQIADEENGRKSFTFNSDKVAIKELVSSLSQNYNIKDFTVHDMEIEDVVRKIYEGEIKL